MDALINLKIGDNVIVHLIDQDIFSGKINSIGNKYSFIVIEDVRYITDDISIPGQQRFYQSEIKRVKRVSESNVPDEPPNAVNHVQSTTKYEKDPSTENKQKIQSIPKTNLQNEYDFFKDRLSRITFIQQCDSTYYKAMKDIAAQDMIALSMEGVSCGRLRPATLISFATPHTIYILDLLCFGKLFPEVKAILESPTPRKIVFDSRFLCDNLHNSLKCNIDGMMDLMVIHIAISKETRQISLRECLEAYFMPIQFPPDVRADDWRIRPLSSDLLHSAACQVAFHHKLYLTMVHDTLLKPLQLESIKFSKAYRKFEDNVDACIPISENRDLGLSEVESDCIDVSSLHSLKI